MLFLAVKAPRLGVLDCWLSIRESISCQEAGNWGVRLYGMLALVKAKILFDQFRF